MVFFCWTEGFKCSFESKMGKQLTFNIAVTRVTYPANIFPFALVKPVNSRSLNITYRETNKQDIIGVFARGLLQTAFTNYTLRDFVMALYLLD